jgi:hypothetical protein
MLFNRTNSWVALGFLAVLILTSPSFGQGPQGFQIFAPADESTFGGGQEPNEGYFFQYDGLYWSISAPKVHPIGYPGTRTVSFGPTDADVGIQVNTLDTSFLDSQFSAGNRFEFGRVEDRNGWLVGIYQQRSQSQFFQAAAADVVFNDPDIGPLGQPLLYGNVNNDNTIVPPYTPAIFKNLPVTFYNVNLANSLNTWGVEMNYLHRFMTGHSGGTFEMFLGARYFEFNESFRVSTAADDGTHTIPSFLGGSFWSSQADNHVVGPQIGLRWFKKQGRWTFSTEGRFMAGYNSQNIRQQVDMGPGLNPGQTVVSRVNATPPPTLLYDYVYPPFQPKVMSHTTATHVTYAHEWSPAVELRLEGRYEITRTLSFHAGWTGMWMDGIARASSVIDYTVPSMGVDLSDNRQNLLLNGLTLGFDINR